MRNTVGMGYSRNTESSDLETSIPFAGLCCLSREAASYRGQLMRQCSFLQILMLISAAGKVTIAVTLKTWEWDEHKRGFSRSVAACKNWLLKECNRWREFMPL